MAFKLCLKLGYAHPDKLLKELTSEQLAEWAAFLRIEPDADSRSDVLQAQLLTLTANINRGKDDAPFSPYDFLPWVEKPPEKELSEKENTEGLMQAFGFRS